MSESYVIDAPAVALTAGTAKSVLVAIAASTQPFRVIHVGFGCDATASGLLKVEMLVGTLTGGTTGTAPNVARNNSEAYSKSPLTTASLYSAEPTYTKHASNGALAIWTRIFALPATEFEIEFPLGREPYCPESNVMALRLTTTTVSPNGYATLVVEE